MGRASAIVIGDILALYGFFPPLPEPPLPFGAVLGAVLWGALGGELGAVLGGAL